MVQDAFLSALNEALPAGRINQDPQTVAHSCTDWRKRYHSHALALTEPHNTKEAQQIVTLCHQYDVAITTQGGNTGLVGGAVPLAHSERPHIVLSTKKLRETLEIDHENLTITVSAGYTLREIQEAADRAGFLFPLSLASEGSCTIGGNLASNAGGVAVLKYGNTRELTLGLEFITADANLCSELRGLRKNNTGYDLRHLLIGSEGTLGIITKACLKVFPKPKASLTAWLNVQNIQSAVHLLGKLQARFFNEISSYEWMNPVSVGLVHTHFDLTAPGLVEAPDAEHVLIQFESLGEEISLREAVESELASLLEEPDNGLMNAYLSQNLKEAAQWWAVRENISEAQAKEGLNVKHDIACAVSKLPEFHDKAITKLEQLNLGIRPVLFGHLGDGNLHFNVSGPNKQESQHFLQQHQDTINKAVYAVIAEVGGTISAEHGIGQLKAGLLKEVTAPQNYALFKALKQAFDPKNILNPGKLLI